MGRNIPIDPYIRFTEKVEPVTESGCWIWTAHVNNNGYGQFYDGSKVVLAHRYSYSVHNGDIGSKEVMHSCDIPCCVNPSHLIAGTHRENMRDMAMKGRSNKNYKVRGSDAKPSKLEADQVLKIREMYDSGGFSQRKIASIFCVSQSAVKCITKRQVWRHI